MSKTKTPRINIWPFLLWDALLLTTAGIIVQVGDKPLSPAMSALCVVCVVIAAWVGVLPFLKNYQTEQKLAEVESLSSTMSQINDIKLSAKTISQVMAYLQTLQDQSEKTISAAGEVTEKMVAESRAFQEFLTTANDKEKTHLRLEVEKLHRSENNWLNILTFILDHVFSLYQAGVKSGQPDLVNQLGSFQKACREAGRRVGLHVIEPQRDEPFNSEIHRVPKDAGPVADESVIDEVISCGINYQGKLIRTSLVSVRNIGDTSSLETDEEISEEMELPEPKVYID